MDDLITLQEKFKQFILSGKGNVSEYIEGNEEEKNNRLSIYAGAYRQHCLLTLKADFPLLQAWIGEEKFKTLAQQYINFLQTDHFSIHYIGQKFPPFLKKTNLQYAEIAQLEWFIDEVLDEQDAKTLSMESLQHIAAINLADYVFKFVPGMRLMKVNGNIHNLWQAHQHQQSLPALIKMPSQPLLIFRSKNMLPQYCVLGEAEYCMWQTIQAGYSFAEICEALCQYKSEEEVPGFAISLIQQWVEQGLFAEF